MKLSIIICAYNERRTILDAIQQAHAVDLGPGWDKEILVIDNCSTDGTRELLQEVDLPGVRVIYHSQNLGKSGSLKTGIAEASGDYFVIFDADLEYEAHDIPRMVAQIVPPPAPPNRGGSEGGGVAVYGSRTLGGRKIYKYAKNYWGVRFLSIVTNLFYGSHLSDVAVGLKLARVDVVRALNLQGSGVFGLEFEMTFKLLKRGYEIHEIATAYHPRTVAEGKKLKAFRTGFHTLWLIVKMRFWD
jgi:glycosyltransferase involved in cell wall biosynthesis